MHFAFGARSAREVNPMCRPFFHRLFPPAFLVFSLACPLFAQEPSATPPQIPPVAPAATAVPALVPANEQLIVPAGTRLPLVLRNNINTRTAKPGDSVYF